MMLDLMDVCAKNSSNNLTENLQSFVDGPCAPLIIVPGFAATSLQLEIDCEKMME